MGGIGIILGLAAVAVVFVAFDRLVRLLGGVAGAIRYSVAPSMVRGIRSWSEARVESERCTSAGGDPESPAGDDGGAGTRPDADEALVVPVTRVSRRGGRAAA